MTEVGGNCQEFLCVEKSLEKFFSIPTLLQYVSHSDWPNIHTNQSKKMGESIPQRPYNLKQRKAWSWMLSSMTPSGAVGVVSHEWSTCSVRSARTIILTSLGTQRAGLPGIVSSLPRVERGRWFECFLSQDGSSRPDLVEASWLRRRWGHQRFLQLLEHEGPHLTAPERSCSWQPVVCRLHDWNVSLRGEAEKKWYSTWQMG